MTPVSPLPRPTRMGIPVLPLTQTALLLQRSADRAVLLPGEDGTPAHAIPPGFKGTVTAEGLSLGAPCGPPHPAGMREQHCPSSQRREEVPSRDGPRGSECPSRGQIPAPGTAGAHEDTSQLQATRAASARNSPAQTVLALRPWAAHQPKHHCQGQRPGAGQVTARHLCQAAAPGAQHRLCSWSRRALSIAGMAAKPPPLQEDPERCVRTTLELPGSANQLQPAGPCTRNTDELCQAGASGGAGSAARPWGAAPAAPRHSPHCQRVSSTVTARHCRARTQPQTPQPSRRGRTDRGVP